MANVSKKSKSNAAAGRRPVLGICGFYGYGNYGDELFLEVFREYLGGDFELRVVPDLTRAPYFSMPVDEAVAAVDAILIGGGDLVQGWSVDPRYFHRSYLSKPVFIAGVGVPIRAKATAGDQVEKPECVAKYREFFNHPNIRLIGVRDSQAADWIKSRTSPSAPVIEAPDIVCALSLPKVGQGAAGDPMLGIVTRYRPRQGGQDDYTQLRALCAHATREGWRIRHIILGTGDVGTRDAENAAGLDVPGKELVRSESLDDLSRAIGQCSALASMKFHGSVVATMYGIPSVVLVPTNKNRNFMRRIGREVDLVCKFDSRELVSRFTPFPAPIDPDWVAKLRVDAIDMLGKIKDMIQAEVGAGRRL